MAFTTEEQALIDSWVAGYAEQSASLQASLQIAQDEYDKTLIEKSIYQKTQQKWLDILDDLLVAKKAEIELADPGFVRTVEYLGGHPQNGGTNPTAWQITHDDMGEVVDYSHSDNWDNDPDILEAEGKWTIFRNWQVDQFYGTDRRLDSLDGAIDGLNIQIAAVDARYAEFAP